MSTNPRYRYPRTPHLPGSPGASGDDQRLVGVSQFAGTEVVVTEKLDGECTSLYPDGLHARSLDSAHHRSRDRLRALHASIAYLIPAGHRICGENVYARHSIAYRELPAIFFVFAAYNAANQCLSWDDTVALAQQLGLDTVPVLYRGLWDPTAVEACFSGTGAFGAQEGFVVRPAGPFAYEQHGAVVAKWVRENHVQTDEHWRRNWVPNELATERM